MMRGLSCFSATYVYGVVRYLARFQSVLLPKLLPRLSARILGVDVRRKWCPTFEDRMETVGIENNAHA
jgi:hypothetical protein